jgi:hypothetical protein
VAIAPVQGWSDQATRINVTYVWDVGETALGHPAAFCRLGGRVGSAATVTDDTVVCIALPTAEQSIEVAISFDGKVWSTEEFQFLFKNRFDILGILPIVALYAIAVAGIAVCIWKAAAPLKAEHEEGHPFLASAWDLAGAGIGRKKKRPRRRAGP